MVCRLVHVRTIPFWISKRNLCTGRCTQGFINQNIFWHMYISSFVCTQTFVWSPDGQFPPVGGLIPTRDEPNESGVVRKLQELDGLMTGGVAVGVQAEE